MMEISCKCCVQHKTRDNDSEPVTFFNYMCSGQDCNLFNILVVETNRFVHQSNATRYVKFMCIRNI